MFIKIYPSYIQLDKDAKISSWEQKTDSIFEVTNADDLRKYLETAREVNFRGKIISGNQAIAQIGHICNFFGLS